ncbi:hypothetical protein BDE36_2158 [Arcticibacter tournemirensis]|uniref:Uncharacterized protein n=1 Tax=Arcticibacter tournemirensis TaxID=699437 RepID=A0A5M9HIR2_9SPHI|nr:hypothetical protein [Arcticibacter tournemirensis]KAA8485304.1 hypothetical protein F1649_04070 [Arcticibacter tournemirensis]TQM50412.1 hypothetical protein BDE36_2158 [Arcticibacter tournemirensis]
MTTTLEPKKTDLLIRITGLIALLGLTPFAIVRLHNESKNYGVFFMAAFIITLIPELYIKLFLKPVSAVLEDNKIILKYYHGALRQISPDEIDGYSTTEELTNYGKKLGLLLYLKNGKHIDFTEINIKDVSPLRDYLQVKNVHYYGNEKLRLWYLRKYKYDA